MTQVTTPPNDLELYPEVLHGWRFFQFNDRTKTLQPLTGKGEPYNHLHLGDWTKPSVCLGGGRQRIPGKVHKPPVSGCSCGFWGMWTLDIMPQVSKDMGVTHDYYIAHIEIKGKVLISTLGFRAEQIRLKGLLSYDAVRDFSGPNLKAKAFREALMRGDLEFVRAHYQEHIESFEFRTLPKPGDNQDYDSHFPEVPRYSIEEAKAIVNVDPKAFEDRKKKSHSGGYWICPCAQCQYIRQVLRSPTISGYATSGYNPQVRWIQGTSTNTYPPTLGGGGRYKP